MSLLTSSSTIFHFMSVCESTDVFGKSNLLQLDHKECKQFQKIQTDKPSSLSAKSRRIDFCIELFNKISSVQN